MDSVHGNSAAINREVIAVLIIKFSIKTEQWLPTIMLYEYNRGVRKLFKCGEPIEMYTALLFNVTLSMYTVYIYNGGSKNNSEWENFKVFDPIYRQFW